VATVHNTVKEMSRAHLTLVHVFHAYASVHTPWVAHTLSHFTPIRYGMIASVSTAHEATQFAGAHKISYALVKTQTCSSGPDDRSLTDTGEGYHLRAPNFRSDHSSFLPIQYSPFSPNCPVRSPIVPTFDHFAKPHMTSINRKGPIMSRF
jgi:hypothetical protein